MEEGGVRKLDKWGYEVNTTSESCISAIDSYYHQVLSYGRETRVILEATLHDKDCVLANILAACFLASTDPSRAPFHVQAAKSCLEQATPYEKEVFDAVNSLICENRDDDVAVECHSKLLSDYPKDLVSLKRAQVLCFYMGRPDLSLNLVQQVLSRNQQEDYIYGMLAFPLLELGRMAEAGEAARKGYEINKQDCWSQHALCHVLQYQCHFKEAVDFMEEHSSSWSACSSFMLTHNWWHTALCYLEGHSSTRKILEVYDHHIWKELERADATPPEVYLNALGLLLRVYVRGELNAFGDRLKTLASCITDQHVIYHGIPELEARKPQIPSKLVSTMAYATVMETTVKALVSIISHENSTNWYLKWHLDVLILWALAKTGETSRAEDLLKGLKSRFSKMTKKKQQRMHSVILLAEALYHYGKGNDKQALDLLDSEFDANGYKMLGASDEQLDVFNEVWYSMLLNTGQSTKAIEVMEKRIKKREGFPFMWRLLETGYAMIGRQEAMAAGDKARALEAAYFV